LAYKVAVQIFEPPDEAQGGKILVMLRIVVPYLSHGDARNEIRNSTLEPSAIMADT
jgi:hypothetical protein